MTGLRTIRLNSKADVTTQVKQDLLNNNLDKLIINFNIYPDDTQKISQNVFDPNQKEIKFDIEIRSESVRMLFSELTQLEKITGKIVANNLKVADYIFNECEKLTTIPKLSFPKLKNALSMFIGCSSLTQVDLDFPKLKDATYMFGGCESLTTINLKYDKLDDSSLMFSHCTSLTAIPDLDFSSVTRASSMFKNCTGLQSVPDLNYPNLKTASGMFKNCSELKTVGDLTFPHIEDASGIFEGCNNIKSIGNLVFGKNYDIYHCFLDKFSIFESGIPYFRDNYLKEINVYPDWYFRPSISGNIFNFDTFFDEMFKFISSYRGLGNLGFGIDSLKNEMLNEQLHIDVIEIYSRIMNNYLNSKVSGSHIVDISNPPPSIFVLDNDRDTDCIRSILDMFFDDIKHSHDPDDSIFELRRLTHESYFNKTTPLNNFEIEFSDEKKYIIIGTYRISQILKEGKKLIDKYPESKWTDLVGKIINILKDKPYHEDVLNKAIDELGKADDKPVDIKDWLHKVKNREISLKMLGCFEPSSYPLKIVMYTETIREEADKYSLSVPHLFETVFAHEFFHALHFVVCMLKQLENKKFNSKLFKIFDIICNKITQTTAEEIWKYIQEQTVNHMLNVNGRNVSREVEEPLAVAFEISWVKDRMITQSDMKEWSNIMNYEWQRFSGIYTYPINPYYGGLYLVTTKSARNVIADEQTINKNISDVLKLSAKDMQKAYDHIQKLM